MSTQEQVIHHGVRKEIVEKMEGVAREFFSLPVEEKMKSYSDDPAKTMRLSTSFNVKKETIHNWRDYLRLHCYPLEKYSPEGPSNPSSFKEIVSNYCREVRELGMRLEEAISESLGLEKECIKKVLGEQGQHMAVNYYPACPEPELTYGLPGHTDPNALTIRLQGLNLSGLQVLKQGRWLAVKPDPDAFVINIGDQFYLEPVARPEDPRRKELEILEEQKCIIDKTAESLVRRELWCGLAFFTVQTAGFMRLTFWDLSWDVMEPICFYVTSMYFVAGYAFYLRTAKEPSFEGFFQSRFSTKQRTLMTANKFDLQKYNELREACYPQPIILS